MAGKIFSAALSVLVLSGCATANIAAKNDAFPLMYTDKKPVSMIVVPAINESTAADAGDLLNVTIAQPFTNQGYYVLPIPIVADVFRREGILEGAQIKGLPAGIFRRNFGADSVLFVTIANWQKSYMVIAANITVGIEYVLLSTDTNEVLWSYEQKVVIDTGGATGNLLVDLVSTAINTALANYVTVAKQVHDLAIQSLPFGKYHPRSGTDGAMKSVDLSAKDAALANQY